MLVEWSVLGWMDGVCVSLLYSYALYHQTYCWTRDGEFRYLSTSSPVIGRSLSALWKYLWAAEHKPGSILYDCCPWEFPPCHTGTSHKTLHLQCTPASRSSSAME